VLYRTFPEQEKMRQLGFAQASRFQLEPWLDQLESHYQRAMALQGSR
jgi:hypothetical protein